MHVFRPHSACEPRKETYVADNGHYTFKISEHKRNHVLARCIKWIKELQIFPLSHTIKLHADVWFTAFSNYTELFSFNIKGLLFLVFRHAFSMYKLSISNWTRKIINIYYTILLYLYASSHHSLCHNIIISSRRTLICCRLDLSPSFYLSHLNSQDL